MPQLLGNYLATTWQLLGNYAQNYPADGAASSTTAPGLASYWMRAIQPGVAYQMHSLTNLRRSVPSS